MNLWPYRRYIPFVLICKIPNPISLTTPKTSLPALGFDLWWASQWIGIWQCYGTEDVKNWKKKKKIPVHLDPTIFIPNLQVANLCDLTKIGGSIKFVPGKTSQQIGCTLDLFSFFFLFFFSYLCFFLIFLPVPFLQ